MDDRSDDSAPPAATPDLAAELARARERIAFYQGFDRLIQENIARSGDLLRQALEERDAATREIAAAREEVEARLRGQRETLLALAAEVQGLGRQVNGLSRRLLDALDALGEGNGAPAAETAPVATLPERAPVPLRPEPVALSASLDTAAATGIDAGAPSPRPAIQVEEAVDAEAGFVHPSAEDAPAVGEAHPVTVIVHGMPGAVAALSLQRHLASLAGIESVEAREFLAGVARYEVMTRGTLSLDDLRGWDGGQGFEPVHVLPEVVELRLPDAAGL